MQRPMKSRAWEAMTSVLKKGPDGSESKVFIEQAQWLNSVPKTCIKADHVELAFVIHAKWRQADLWGSQVSQPKGIGEFHTTVEEPASKDKIDSTQEKISEVEIDLWPLHMFLEMRENMYVCKHMKEQTHI